MLISDLIDILRDKRSIINIYEREKVETKFRYTYLEKDEEYEIKKLDNKIKLIDTLIAILEA